jgi:hemerythrin
MSLTLKFYTQIEYDEKNMCELFRFFINFINSYIRYIHDKLIYTWYVSKIKNRSPWAGILSEIQAVGRLLPAYVFKHTRREDNQVAHCLTQTALRQQQCVVMRLNAPAGVHALLDREAPGWALAGNLCNSVLPS